MRITFLAPAADMSGGARVIHIHAARLQERGHQVAVIVRPPRPPSFRERIRAVIEGGGRGNEKKENTHFRSTDYSLRMLDEYRPILTDDVPDGDVVIATWWETAEWMRRLPETKGQQAHFVQGYEAFGNMPKDRVDAVLSAPSFKITISKWLDILLKDEFGNRDVAMVPNSVDINQFYAVKRDRQAKPTVGMLYSSLALKDCRTGLKAFEMLRQELPDAQLITFGLTAPSADLPLPIGASHTIMPQQDKIRDIYAQCDVWFCPSTREGFHLPPLEAMACRCPVISTPVGGPIDTIVEGVNGFFVPIGDPVCMAARLKNFFSLPEDQWRYLSDAAYATAIEYSWDDATDRFEQHLRNIVIRDNRHTLA